MNSMVDGSRIREFWLHWEHEPNPTAEFESFRVRLTVVFRKLWDDFFKAHETMRERFALISGTPCSAYEQFSQCGLCSLLKEAKTVFQLANTIQYFLWTIETQTEGNVGYCCCEIQKALDLSPAIMIRLVRNGKSATLYPSGARLLDETLVEGNLIWLTRYPDVRKPFETALKLYMAKIRISTAVC
jgi:hypothetical protein